VRGGNGEFDPNDAPDRSQFPMKIVSVINYKGGVGKTTVTANLGAELARRGQRVLLIDLDPQSSLTFSFVRPEDWDRELAQNRTIKTWFDSFDSQVRGGPMQLSDLLYPIRLPQLAGEGRLDLIPSHLGLINVDLELAVELGGSSLNQVKKNYRRVHRRLAEGLQTISPDAYDLVLIDCPPSFNVVTKTAIVASQHILIPAKPDYLSTLGIEYLKYNLNLLVRYYNECAHVETGAAAGTIHPGILGVVFAMVQEYNGQPIAASKIYMNQVKNLNIEVFSTYIRENKALFSEAPEFGIPVVLKRPQSAAHRQIIGEIQNFVSEFQSQLGRHNGACDGQSGTGVDFGSFGAIGGVAQTT
jgi:chromosome partitioning protein